MNTNQFKRVARRASASAAIVTLAVANLSLLSYAPNAMAEDIDIFTVNAALSSSRPNVLLMLDNSANWGSQTKAPFVNEKAALVSVVNGLEVDKFNVGLMLFSETGNGNNNPTDDGYIRAAVRQLTSANKTALAAIVGELDSGGDKSNNVGYGLGMAEAYRYFRGATAFSGVGQKKRDYFQNNTGSAANVAQYHIPNVTSSTHAFTSSSSTIYNSPISDACQKNFIILISNGPATDSNTGSNSVLAKSQLTAAGGNTTEMPLLPNGSQANNGDEWARFVGNTDVNATTPGTQNIIVYTVDVNPSSTGGGPGHTALLRSMSEGVGKGGRYFAVTDANGGAQIQMALNEIFAEVLAKNSVFAASALPASVSPRGTFLNQVYMGVFRPDGQARPRWPGNLKQYKLGKIGGSSTVQLVDNGSPIRPVENAVTGFVNPAVRSFWSQPSTFWGATTYPSLQDASATPSPSAGPSDAPDGDLIEKGGAAYRLRTIHATNVTSRKLFTCGLACAANTVLTTSNSATIFDIGNADITAAGLGDASFNRDEVIRWLRGENTKLDDNNSPTKTVVRGYIHGDVVHSKPSIINYNRVGEPVDRDIWVYYGGNDGILRAVKGGPDNSDGYEQWGFIAPEFFNGLGRNYNNAPVISSAARKPYFFDGPTTVWTFDANSDGRITAGGSDKALLFASTRRGGRLLYAFDVTDPVAPKFLWKIDSSTLNELGQTFGEVRVVKVRGQSDPVLVLPGGYDATANDIVPRGATTMGRGLFLLNALTGTPIWHAGGAATSTSAGTYRQVSGMDYSIVPEPVVIDSNNDGFFDRIYVVDTDANVWRVNIDTGSTNLPSTWNGAKLAALGGTGSDQRKFLQAPDVVPYDSTYDAVLIGSGDRENPLDVSIQNHFYMIKDAHALTALPTSPATIGGSNSLFNVTTTSAVPAGGAGWYFALSQGEKVVTGSTTLNGVTFFSTNVPESTLTSVGGSCSAGLGEARDYQVSFREGAPVNDFNADGSLTLTDRYQKRAGGGLPPSPVAATVCLGPNGTDCNELVLSGSKVSKPPAVQLGRRYRSFWSIKNERQ